MADSLSISPVALPGLAGIPPVAFQRLTTGEAASTSSVFNNASNLVELSSSGQLLSAVSSFRTNLQALQTDAANNSPAALASTAQSLVDAFNGLQGKTTGLQTIATALSGGTLATQMSQALSQLATGTIAVNSATLSSLQSIGINFQTTPAPTLTGTAVPLNIDQNILAAAINANPAGTQAVLAGTIQSFIGRASEFESQAASTAVSLTNLAQRGIAAAPQIDLSSIVLGPANPAPQGVRVSTDLLQQLSADTVLNAIQLSDLDLAGAGLDTGTLLAEDGVIRDALVSALLTSINPPSIASITGTPPASINVDTTNPLAGTPTPDARKAPATEPGVETSLATMPAIPPATTATTTATAVNQATTTAALEADAMAAERRATASTQALQTQLADPALRAIRNHFDPAYSALIAASHLSDFVSPSPILNPKALAGDAITPVSSIAASRAIAYYNETAGT